MTLRYRSGGSVNTPLYVEPCKCGKWGWCQECGEWNPPPRPNGGRPPLRPYDCGGGRQVGHHKKLVELNY